MTSPEAARPAVRFGDLMTEVSASHERFNHRAHLHLTWLAVRRVGMPAAVRLVSDGIADAAHAAGAPTKYHATMSRAWVELVAHHAVEDPVPDFVAFIDQHPALLDQRLLTRFYRSTTLSGAAARASWVEPDLAPFPWHASR